jgi:hypothetical protein
VGNYTSKDPTIGRFRGNRYLPNESIIEQTYSSENLSSPCLVKRAIPPFAKGRRDLVYTIILHLGSTAGNRFRVAFISFGLGLLLTVPLVFLMPPRNPSIFFYMEIPPSEVKTCPVTKLEASEARKMINPLSSAGFPLRPIGVVLAIVSSYLFRRSSSPAAFIQ